MGETTKTAQLLLDPSNNESKLFFVFNDLSIRIMGIYRFRIQVFNMKSLECEPITKYTQYFKVYSEKKFQKPKTWSILTRSFAIQGIQVEGNQKKLLGLGYVQ